MEIARRFEALLDVYRRSDGRSWSGQDLHRATNGAVTRSYVTNLRKGRIRNPGYEKLREIAGAMGFPPRLWFEEDSDPEVGSAAQKAAQGGDIAARVTYLFEAVENRETGNPYTDAEVSLASLKSQTPPEGGLTEDEVKGIRTGGIPNPSVNQILALADVFGVQPSYFIDNGQAPVLDYATMRALEDKASSAILHRSMRLSSRERDAILGIIQQFEDLRNEPEKR